LTGGRGVCFIDIVGSKKSGKTTLATFLVRRLVRKGYRVASIKHVHHRGFSIDTPGKDSWRLTKAGSHTVVVISPDEMGQITSFKHISNRRLFPLAVKTALGIRPDIIVIEGFASMPHVSSRRLVTIVMARDEDDLSSTLDRVHHPVFAISGRIAETASGANHDGIPILKYPTDRELLLRTISRALCLT
jgi:molybdopterin-guanine dinucleotide biosynthesis protein MobB